MLQGVILIPQKIEDRKYKIVLFDYFKILLKIMLALQSSRGFMSDPNICRFAKMLWLNLKLPLQFSPAKRIQNFNQMRMQKIDKE